MRVQLLEAEPSLGTRLPPAQRAEASRSLPVAVIELPAGPWAAPHHGRTGHLGYLVLDGILIREVSVSRDWSAEMLGQGDVLRPWLEDGASFVTARWEALEPVKLAVLDSSVTASIGGYPILIDELVERALRRSRSLAVHAVIEGVHRIDQRLLLLFWHLAEQRGQRENGRTVVPVRLTHDHLARLVGARRPTVTTALGALERAGKLSRSRDGLWQVAGEPPGSSASE